MPLLFLLKIFYPIRLVKTIHHVTIHRAISTSQMTSTNSPLASMHWAKVTIANLLIRIHLEMQLRPVAGLRAVLYIEARQSDKDEDRCGDPIIRISGATRFGRGRPR